MDALPLPAPVCTPYPVRDLVETARARIARQAQYAALIAKGGSRAAVARDWLEQAAACVASLARPQAALFEFVFPRFLGRAAPLNRDQLVMLEEDNVGDPWPATELFGLALRPFRDGVARCLAAVGTPPPC